MSDGNIYQDTLATCNRYSNPISDEYRVYQRARTEPVDIDRYIASETNKEKEMIEQMLFNIMGKKNGTLFLMGKMGKNLFFSILLSPFHLVFKMPKWLFQNVLPKLIDATNTATNVMKNLVNRLTENLKTMDQQLGKFLKTAANSTTDAAGSLAAMMKLGEAYATLQGMLAHLASLQNSKMKEAGKGLESLEKGFREKVNTARQKVAELIQKPLENLKKEILKSMDKAGELIQSGIDRVTEPFKQAAEKIGNGIQKITQKVQETLQPPFNWILENYKQLAHLANKHGTEIAEAISKIDKKIKKKGEELQAYVSDGMHKVSEIVTNTIGIVQIMQIIPDPVISLYTNISTFGQNTMKETRNKWQSMVARTREMIQKIKRRINGLKQWFYEQQQRIKKAILWLFDKLIETILKFYNYLLVIMKQLFSIFKKVWRGVRIFFSVAGLMLRYTFLMLRESFR